MNHPIPVKPDDVSSHLTCAICLNVPMEPSITPCQHIFCRGCLAQHRDNRGYNCPTCRAPTPTLTPLAAGGLIYRVWSEIAVKCGNCERGCAWTGSIHDANNHMRACSFADQSKKLRDEIQTLKTEFAKLKPELETLRRENSALKYSSSVTEIQNQELLVRIDDLQCEITAKEALMYGKDLVPKLFHGNYHYDRFAVEDLTELILRFRTNKPYNIDSNRIYNCVRACNEAFERGYSDNPVNYRLHVQALLATCLTSSWFSNNQWSNIDRWRMNHGW